MDKQAAREKAWEFYWRGPITNPESQWVIDQTKSAFNEGYDAGYKAAGEWVRIETADDLPRHNGFVDVTLNHSGIRYVSIARVLNGVWLDYVNDRPVPSDYISAWRERPEPFTEPLTEQTGGENGN